MEIARRRTRPVRVGRLVVGGGRPIVVQSMTTTTPDDLRRSLAQIAALAAAGCRIVRLAVPSLHAVAALPALRRAMRDRGLRVSLVADVHFNPRLALEAAPHVEKVRINPGNFASSPADAKRQLAPLVAILRQYGAALRIGVNHGSLAPYIADSLGHGPQGMVASAIEYLRLCRGLGFGQTIVSLKASNPALMVEANRLLVRRMKEEGFDAPLHLGVTEAGEGVEGALRSAVGLGALLLDGIGDTIRVSLAGDPVEEIPVCRRILGAIERAAEPRAPASRRDGPLTTTARPRAAQIGPLTLGGTAPPPVELTIPLRSRATRGAPGKPPWMVPALAAVRDRRLPVESICLQPTASLDPRACQSLGEDLRRFRAELRRRRLSVALWLEVGPRQRWWRVLWTTGRTSWDPHAVLPVDLLRALDGLRLRVPTPTIGAGRHAKTASRSTPPSRALRDLLAHVTDSTHRVPVHTPGRAAAPPAIRWDLDLSDRPARDAHPLAAIRRIAALAPRLRALTCEAGCGEALFSWSGRPLVAAGMALARVFSPGGSDTERPILLPHLPPDPWEAAVTLGSLLLDGLADGIVVSAAAAPTSAARALGLTRPQWLAGELLQASRRRLLRAEFIACPGCGRLHYDLAGTVRRLRRRLAAARGVKIAVMGCAVNGPGEMADADFGYVGSAAGKVDLYEGRRRLHRGLSPAEADRVLVRLMHERGLLRRTARELSAGRRRSPQRPAAR